MAKDNYEAIKAVISFKAPDPDDTPIDREAYGRGNFAWQKYRLWFQKEQEGEDQFFVYQTELNANGTEQRPGKPIIVESDSSGTFDPNNETEEVKVSDMKKLFPRWFGSKGPKLFPDDAVTYVNTEGKKNKEYDKQKFLKEFDNEHYIVVDKTSILKDVTGDPIGTIPPEKSPNPEDKVACIEPSVMFKQCVTAAKEKAFSGGFDIMKKLVKRERKKQKEDKVIERRAGQNDPKKYYGKRRLLEELEVQKRAPQRYPSPKVYSDGFGIVQNWQEQHGSHARKDPNEFKGGFDIVRKWQQKHKNPRD